MPNAMKLLTGWAICVETRCSENYRESPRELCWNGEPTRIREKIAVAGENLNVHSLFWLSRSSILQLAVLEQCWKVFESSSLTIWTPVSNLTWFLPDCTSVDGCLSCLAAFFHQEITTLLFDEYSVWWECLYLSLSVLSTIIGCGIAWAGVLWVELLGGLRETCQSKSVMDRQTSVRPQKSTSSSALASRSTSTLASNPNQQSWGSTSP